MGEDGERKVPPSFTREELRAIQDWERTHRSPTVRRLLWEVFRLRAIALRADQFESMAREVPGVKHNETGLPVVSALDDVHRQSSGLKAGLAWHESLMLLNNNLFQ